MHYEGFSDYTIWKPNVIFDICSGYLQWIFVRKSLLSIKFVLYSNMRSPFMRVCHYDDRSEFCFTTIFFNRHTALVGRTNGMNFTRNVKVQPHRFQLWRLQCTTAWLKVKLLACLSFHFRPDFSASSQICWQIWTCYLVLIQQFIQAIMSLPSGAN